MQGLGLDITAVSRPESYLYLQRCVLYWSLGAVTRAMVRGGPQHQRPSVLRKMPLDLGLAWRPVQQSAEHSQERDKSQLLVLSLRAVEVKPAELKSKTKDSTGVGQMAQLVKSLLHSMKT